MRDRADRSHAGGERARTGHRAGRCRAAGGCAAGRRPATRPAAAAARRRSAICPASAGAAAGCAGRGGIFCRCPRRVRAGQCVAGDPGRCRSRGQRRGCCSRGSEFRQAHKPLADLSRSAGTGRWSAYCGECAVCRELRHGRQGTRDQEQGYRHHLHAAATQPDDGCSRALAAAIGLCYRRCIVRRDFGGHDDSRIRQRRLNRPHRHDR